MMDYLSRDDAPFSDDIWQRIDDIVTGTAAETLKGRRFLPFRGPLGAGVSVTNIDGPQKEEGGEDGFSVIQDQRYAQIPQLYEDFWLYWRDMEAAKKTGVPLDLSVVNYAAQTLALREDNMIFYGVKSLGIEGLLTAKGTFSQKRSDWAAGEGAFADVVNAVNALLQKGHIGRHTLVVSQDLFVQLQRIQGNTGVLESDRIAKLVEGRLYSSTTLQPKTALLLSAQPQYLDLTVGQDIRAGYTEAVDFNHHLRILETALLRIKIPDAIVVFK